MAAEKSSTTKSTSKPAESKSSSKSEKKASTDSSKKDSSSKSDVGRNGKGSGPRNIFSEEFRSNFDGIDWSK